MFQTMRRRISLPPYSIRPKRILIILFLSFLFIGLFSLFYYGFQIKSIKIVSSVPLSLRGLSDIKNKNNVLLSDEEIVKNIQKTNPSVKKVRVQKKYPNEIILTIDVHQPIAALRVHDGVYILSADGTLLERTKAKPSSKLPLISSYQVFPYTAHYPGQQIELKEIVTALFFVNGMKETGLPCEHIDIKSLDMIVCNVRNKTILFTSQKDATVQQYELQTIIRQFKIEGKDFKSLDVRFDKPIVTF